MFVAVSWLWGVIHVAMLGRAFVVWLMMMSVETLHGIVRIKFLTPRVGDFRARQIGVFSGSSLLMVVVGCYWRWLDIHSSSMQLLVGALWVIWTLGFEIGLGRFVAHLSWQRIFSDFDLPRGGLLPLGLAVMALAPRIAAIFLQR